eukprot:TRINITY_DN11625_c0_g1_i2.p1 TRINITY_DN11625_c0_g1~~TRINITY_DN11625_c0_g1_i2.p1  ORF type:complete len:192 (+),score=32.25 TRINITY_DN11625_c0_g1_i2:70-576(+)
MILSPLPAITGTVVIFTLVVCFYTMYAMAHYPYTPPFVSLTGDLAPESYFFSLGLTLAAAMGGFSVYAVYQSMQLMRTRRNLSRSNTSFKSDVALASALSLSLVAGLVSAFSLALVANLSYHWYPSYHEIALLTLFISTAVHGLSLAYVNYVLGVRIHKSASNVLSVS